jgi:hypothetical protein
MYDGRQITFVPYKKPQDESTPLHALSNTPKHWKIGMVFGEVHRLATTWNGTTDRDMRLQDIGKMVLHWKEAGYNTRWILFHIFQALESIRMRRKQAFRALNGLEPAETILQGLKPRSKDQKFVRDISWISEYLPGDEYSHWIVGAALAVRGPTPISNLRPTKFSTIWPY